MIVMRVLAAILCTAIMYMFYKNLKDLEFSSQLGILATIGMVYLFWEHFCIDYNFFILLIALILLKIEQKQIQKNDDIFNYNRKIDIAIGIIAGISFTMKQTAGLILCFVVCCYKLLAVRNKEQLKTFFKIFLIRGFSMVIPVAVLLMYLLINGIFIDFIDYAVLGIKDFTNSISYIDLFYGNLKFLAVLVPCIICCTFIWYLKTKDNKVLILFAYCLSTLIIVYPISDEIHFLIASTITLMVGMYFIKNVLEYVYNYVENNLKEKKKLIFKIAVEATEEVVILAIGIFTIGNLFINLHDVKIENYKKIQNFKYIPVSSSLRENIEIIDKYISKSDKKVYVLDASAAIYMIPLDRYNKNYDMFLAGNIGGQGADGMIEELKKQNNIELLILKSRNAMNWQTPMKVIDFVEQNYSQTGEIAQYNIYSIEN